MASKVLYFCLLLVAMVRQGQKCNETKSHGATSALEATIAYWFSEDIAFSERCVADGCPTLKDTSLCSGGMDINALGNITKIMNDCMKRPMCGIVADARPVKPFILSMEEFLPGVDIDGICKLQPDSGLLTNISNIQLEIPSKENQQQPLQVALLIPNMRLHGRFPLEFRLKSEFGPPLTASITEATYDIGIQFISTVFVNKTTTGTIFDIRFENPVVRVRPLFCGIDMPTGFPDILSLFTSTVQTIAERSTMAKVLGKFLERLYRSAIQVVSNNCRLTNATV